MGWEQRNADFCKAQTDAQMAYIEAEREVDQLQAENARLRELVEDMLDCIEIRTAWHRPLTDEMCEEFAQRARELGVDA